MGPPAAGNIRLPCGRGKFTQLGMQFQVGVLEWPSMKQERIRKGWAIVCLLVIVSMVVSMMAYGF